MTTFVSQLIALGCIGGIIVFVGAVALSFLKALFSKDEE